jgi:DNA primase
VRPRRQGPRIPDEVIDRVRERFNISDVAASFGFAFKRHGHEYLGICPWHKERSPSWTLNDAKGFAHCFGCGAHHNTIGLVMDARGVGFLDALRWLDATALPEVDPVVRQEQERACREEKLQQVRDARSWFADAEDVRPGDPVSVYLAARAIREPPPPTIRFARVPAWQDRETKQWGPLRPCMLCACQDVAGTITGVQRIFWPGNNPSLGKADKPKKSWGVISGSALRLGPPTPTVCVAEGPEDGLSARELAPYQSVWTGLGTGTLPKIEFPEVVESVTLLAQNNKAGRLSVAASVEAYHARSLLVGEAYAPNGHDDWNDFLRAARA